MLGRELAIDRRGAYPAIDAAAYPAIDAAAYPGYPHTSMIVECPGCQSRYDVTGRPPGTRARCRCGVLFELPEAPAQQQSMVLECPRCGGHVAATNHACEFCRVELRVKACPCCFARMFQGARHCSQCGTVVVVPAAADAEGEAIARHCPRCASTELVARLIGDVTLDDCPTCRGSFVDAAALHRILNERKQTKVHTMLSELAPPGTSGQIMIPTVADPNGPMYIRCPDCNKHMNRQNFARGSGIVIDVCRSHGTWFDRDELSHVVEFALSGGLDRAERLEAEAAAREERGRQYSKHLASLKQENQHGPFIGPGRPGTAAVLAELFRRLGGFLARRAPRR